MMVIVHEPVSDPEATLNVAAAPALLGVALGGPIIATKGLVAGD
jgi:hypothetical protein